jgi:hypothetical protein
LWPCHGAVENELLAAEVWRESQILKFERRQDKGVLESGLDWEDPTPKLSESQPLEKRPFLKEETRFRGGSLDRGDVSPNAQE